MSEKKRVRFTVVDAVVLVVIVAIIAFVGMKFAGVSLFTGENGDESMKTNTYIVSYYIEEVPDFAAKQVKTGDPVTDDVRNHSLGKVTGVEIGPSVSFNADSNGIVQKSSKEGYCSVILTTEVEADEYKHGIEISKTHYVVGHSMTLYAGGAKMYGRVHSIEAK